MVDESLIENISYNYVNLLEWWVVIKLLNYTKMTFIKQCYTCRITAI